MNPKKEIVFFSQLAYKRKYTVGGEGNISLRIAADRFLITPSGILKPLLTPEDLVTIDAKGKTISGKQKPSSELFTHLEIYQQNPDTKAIIHAHPFFAVLETVLGNDPFAKPFLAESVLFLDRIKIFPYAAPASTDGAESIKNRCADTNALIIEKHGSFTCGKNLSEAFSLLEIIEKCASMHYHAKQSGKKPKILSKKEVERLLEIKNC
jgi:L-fuculose-phosphate aldolase